jgi:hypothetical protein
LRREELRLDSTNTFKNEREEIVPKTISLDMPQHNQINIFTLNLIYFRAEPDLEFEGLLKRQHTRVKYFQGSLMNAMDLERSKVTGLQKTEIVFDF